MSFLLTAIQYHVEAWQTNGNKYQAAEMRQKARKQLGDNMLLVQHKLPFTDEVPHDFQFFEVNNDVLFLNLLQGGYVSQNAFQKFCNTLLLSTEKTILVWFVVHANCHDVHAALIMQYSYEPKQYNIIAFVCREDSNVEGSLWLYMISLADTRRVTVEIKPSYVSPVLRYGMLSSGFMQNGCNDATYTRFPMCTLLDDIELWVLLVQQWTEMLRPYALDTERDEKRKAKKNRYQT